MPSTIDTSVRGGTDRITRAIAQSARRTGVDFDYLMGQARIESGMNPNAKAPTSSATGLYQFISQSWLATVYEHGSKHGLDWAAGAIRRDGRGGFHVPDAAMRQKILDLRMNPEAAAVMAGEFAADNRDYLESRLGREMAPVDLYLAHFLGAGGAHKFLAAHSANPDAAAAPLFGSAARANRNVFYASNGRARSLDEIRDRFAAKLGADAKVPAAGGKDRPGGNELPFVQPADYLRLASQRAKPSEIDLNNNDNARMAYMLLASMGA